MARTHHYLRRMILGLMVVSGLGGCSVSDRLSITRDTPAPVTEAPLRVSVEALPPSGEITVREGDDLFAIATRYQVTPLSILMDNALEDTEITPGQILVVSPRRFHIVDITDDLYTISQRYAVSEAQLARLHGLEEPYQLNEGQRLILPDSQDLSVLNIEGLDDSATVPTVAARAPATKHANIQQPRKSFVAPSLGSAGFSWPLSGEVIVEYGPAGKGVHNDGVKIAANEGTAVLVTAPGTVAYVGDNLKSFGTLVLVKHEGGYISAYAHLGAVRVAEGDVLGTGMTLGQVGQTGNVTTPQLHFEIRRARQPVNPRTLIAS